MGYIYQIYCDVPGVNSTYIGKTTQSVEARFKEHIQEANHTRRNFKIYNAMRHYGIEHFHVKTLGEYDNDKLNEKEIEWIAHYDTFYNGWNSTLGGDGNVIWTEDMKEEQSRLMKEYYSQHKCSDETRAKLSEKMTARWSNNEYRERLSQSQKDSYAQNPERREVQRQNTINRYKDPAEREKSRQAQIKRWSDPEEHKKARARQQKACGKKVLCIETGVIYNCIGDACEALGKKRTATGISMCLNGTREKAFGYHWKRVEENK